jgi:hypothetical protein
MIEAHTLKLHPFRYYNTMSWITKKLRSHPKHIIDMSFLYSFKIQRYHDLYNKFYIGYLSLENAQKILDISLENYKEDQRVVVALEKKHSDEIVLTYYIQTTRKNLYLYSLDDNEKLSKEKKDPYGITVTEVFHINKMMDEKYELHLHHIKLMKNLLKERFLRKSSNK